MIEFSFASRLAVDATQPELMRLVGQIWRNNLRRGVTGALRRSGRQVDQTIEGPCDVILELAGLILTDSRHDAIEIRVFEPIACRQFVGWRVEGFEPVALFGRHLELACDNLRLLPRRQQAVAAGRAPVAAVAAAP